MSGMPSTPLTLADWRAAYAAGASPAELLAPLLMRREADDPAWILRCDSGYIDAQLARLERSRPDELPLYGVPFAVKDNIDVGGLPTTAACPSYAYTPEVHATVVARLMDAGAVLVGKTNLDQFATGLVGTRSPFGAVPNSFDPAYVSGGSSSGSASVVARGLVAFALGTDTAGSGRVPAGFNNLVGLKPTPGRVPMSGVLPACRSLDVVSIFALTVDDAARVMSVIEGADGGPEFQSAELQPAWLGRDRAALRVGVPVDAACDANLGFEQAFESAQAQLRSWKMEICPIDMGPLYDVARLLYDGPWVAERYTVVRDLMEQHPEVLDATVREVIAAARRFDAAASFEARYALETLRKRIEPMWNDIDVLMVPTAPTCPTLEAVAAQPILRNSELGRFTNFVNLLGLAALAVPSGFTPSGLPFGVTFIAPGGSDAALAHWGARWQAARALPLGCHLSTPPREPPTWPDPAADAGAAVVAALSAAPASCPTMKLAVVGAHLSGMPLHGQLSERRCRLVSRTTTAASYRLFALPDTAPPKPGLARVAEGGVAIEVEVYEMPLAAVGSFLALVAPPLGLGNLQMASGEWVKGFICEGAALAGAADISAHGGWRGYQASL
jgi:allophanate hydrolase